MQNYTATRRFDPISRVTWLEFDQKPDDDARAALRADGWSWSGYRKQWFTNRRWPLYPPCVTCEEGGAADYAAERSDRLQTRAEIHAQRSTAAYERSNAAVAHIPLGQPILVGHHSERMHRRDLERSRRAMDQSCAEAKIADRLDYAARSSQRHQLYTQTPEAMTRRADRLAGELRAMQRNIARREQQLAEDGAEPTDYDREYQRRVDTVAAEIAELRAAVEEAGGIKADQLDPRVGDIVQIHGLTGTLKRINPRTYTVTIHPGWDLKLDRTQLQKIITRSADKETPAEA